MKSTDIRKLFFDYFEKHHHTKIPSSPVFLEKDPTLLFTNAGMNQFKNIFLGQEPLPPFSKAVNTQKCLRVTGKHNDLDDVGHDHYHHTFFEMLGSWFFENYSQKEIITLTWNFITEHLGIPVEKLYATVLKQDTESYKLWQEFTNVLPEHLLKEDESTNFWSMGETGVCGFCTEIHYDFGEESCTLHGTPHDCKVNGSCGRFVEIWNIVFISFNRQEDGSLTDLKNKFIDTGMGFERLTRILQNKNSNYDTDLFVSYIKHLENITSLKYLEDAEISKAMRVIADHIRALVFTIADGVIPSNTGRNYVVRRILRRASRYGQTLGLSEPFLFEMVPLVVKNMGDTFPELCSKQLFIQDIILKEESQFLTTLEKGLKTFEKEVLLMNNIGVFSGKVAFLLYDTYGFPLDLTIILAKEKGMSLNTEGFEKEMLSQKERSLESHKLKKMEESAFEWVLLDPHHTAINSTEFIGYTQFEYSQASLIKYQLQKDEGQAILVFDKTVFYPEMGGQTPDTGCISSNSLSFSVLNTQKKDDLILHYVSLEKGSLSDLSKTSSPFLMKIDLLKRNNTKKHHTGIHLLNFVLKNVLKNPKLAYTSNSVSSEALTCDFAHNKLTQDEIFQIEKMMNTLIQQNTPVITHNMTLEEAHKKGIEGRFESKYKENVRIVEIQGLTEDFCGGTHVSALGEIGLFKILSDVSSASGTRRLHAVCGMSAWNKFYQLYTETKNIANELKTSPENIPQRALSLFNELKTMKKNIKNTTLSSPKPEDILKNIHDIATINQTVILTGSFLNYSTPELNTVVQETIKHYSDYVLLLFSTNESTPDKKILYRLEISKNIGSNNSIIQTITQALNKIMHGKGGGKSLSSMGSVNDIWSKSIETEYINILKDILK